MTAAYRLKGLGWFGGCVIVTLGFYLVSLQVAAERKKLDQVNARITVAQREIRALDTEFDTRSNLIQLEKWNGDTLALVAPTAQQFVKSEAQLASIRFDRAVTPGDAPVRTAALVMPSIAPTSQAQALVAPVVTRVVAPPVARAVRVETARVETARVETGRAVTVRPVHAAIVQVAAVSAPVSMGAGPKTVASVRKAQAVAMLDRTLLSDSTIGDLLAGAKSERRLR